MTRILETSELLTIYAPATKRLHLYDYDGTLTPIVDNAARAILSDLHISLLKTLANHPHNTVWVISGRDQAFLQAQLGSLTNIGLVAEHGAFMRRPQSSEWENLATEADMSWKATVRQVMETFESHHPGSFIEEKRVATVLHYRNVEQQGPAEKDAIDCKKSLEKALENWDVEFMSGKCVLEARPTNVDKGQIVRRIVGEMEHTMGCSPDFVFCIGDDVTDEDMFRALRASDLPSKTVFTVTVGAHDKASEAYYYLPEPNSVWATIDMFNKCDEQSLPVLKRL